jgi:hypothetical protein
MDGFKNNTKIKPWNWPQLQAIKVWVLILASSNVISPGLGRSFWDAAEQQRCSKATASGSEASNFAGAVSRGSPGGLRSKPDPHLSHCRWCWPS